MFTWQSRLQLKYVRWLMSVVLEVLVFVKFRLLKVILAQIRRLSMGAIGDFLSDCSTSLGLKR